MHEGYNSSTPLPALVTFIYSSYPDRFCNFIFNAIPVIPGNLKPTEEFSVDWMSVQSENTGLSLVPLGFHLFKERMGNVKLWRCDTELT